MTILEIILDYSVQLLRELKFGFLKFKKSSKNFSRVNEGKTNNHSVKNCLQGFIAHSEKIFFFKSINFVSEEKKLRQLGPPPLNWFQI